MKIHEILKNEAIEFAKANKIVEVGDKVETLWSTWKKPKIVEISSVGARLAYDRMNPCKLVFEMAYVASRIKADGTHLDSGGCGIVLRNLKTEDGNTWEDNLEYFNHCGTSWRI